MSELIPVTPRGMEHLKVQLMDSYERLTGVRPLRAEITFPNSPVDAEVTLVLPPQPIEYVSISFVVENAPKP
jgi:hypothetical protein